MQPQRALPVLPEPTEKPVIPNFSSGPCAKVPTWKLENLKDAACGRSHRSKIGFKKIHEALDTTREILGIPAEYHIGLLPGSATGAIETAIWNLLGARPLTVFVHDVFSQRWSIDIHQQLQLADTDFREAEPGHLPSLENIPDTNDILLNWNGSTSGVRFPLSNWLTKERSGLVVADVTSAVFTTDIPWNHFDAIAFSWQKGIGSESAHGVLVLSPKAVARIEEYVPTWPIPYLFKLRSNNKDSFYHELFEAKTLNTPSLLCLEDYLQSLAWGQSIGGLPALIQRSKDNFHVVEKWVNETPWIDFLCEDPALRSTSTICVKLADIPQAGLSQADQWSFLRAITTKLEEREVAYDILNHGGSFPSLRFWGGATVETSDLKALLPWIDWAYATVLEESASN